MDFWTVRKPGYVGETYSQTCSERSGFRFHKFGSPVYRHPQIRIASSYRMAWDAIDSTLG
jgi:hypothetical protein